MTPTASHEAVKRAYTKRALELHPDRFAGAGDGEQANAEFKMKELNAAWAVLRDPEARKAYDAEHVAATKVKPGDGPHQTVSPVIAGAAEVERPATAPTHRSPWAVYGPMIALGVLLVFVLVLAALAGPADEPYDVETTERFPVGSCVTLVAEDEVAEVPCDAPNGAKVEDKVNFPRPCPSGTEAVVLVGQQLSLCLAP